MSLQVYFYKAKKGTIPTCRGKHWMTQRRMYYTYGFIKDNLSPSHTKAGVTVYHLDKCTFDKLTQQRHGLSDGTYDGDGEYKALEWLAKRNVDFDKFDIYVLFA